MGGNSCLLLVNRCSYHTQYNAHESTVVQRCRQIIYQLIYTLLVGRLGSRAQSWVSNRVSR